jgi:D-alanine-D-alanine ligase
MNQPVVILFGGASEERRVSVASAQNVCGLLPEAELWFATPGGAVHRCRREELLAHAEAFTRELELSGPAEWASLEAALDSPGARSQTYFLAFHGKGVEDGVLQALLESRHLAFTGSGAKASAEAFDKELAKAAARRAGVRVVDSAELPQGEAEIESALSGLLGRFGRAVAKPVRGGSSVGLHHLERGADLATMAKAIARAGEHYMVEQFVPGPELTVGVVDGPRGTRALPCSEVRLDQGRAFDYAGKYLGQGTRELTPAPVPPDVFSAAQDLAIAMHRALGCYGYSRTDLIVSPEGPVFLETNTLPGLTKASFIPQQLAVEGTPMREFVDGQLALARARYDRR